MSDREDNVRKTDQFISKVVELWPLWLTLAGGLVTGINFYNTVKNLADDQKAWKAVSEARRDKNREEFEALRLRLIVVERDMEWVKNLRGK